MSSPPPPQQPPEITPATDITTNTATETGSSSSSPPLQPSTTLLRAYIENADALDEYERQVWEAFNHPETMNDLIAKNDHLFREKAKLIAQFDALEVLVITCFREFEAAREVAPDFATFVVHRSTPESDIAKINEIKDLTQSVFFDVDEN